MDNQIYGCPSSWCPDDRMYYSSLNMEKILISACLLGINCRHDGKNVYSMKLRALFKDKYVLFACPEQLGGLSTPRPKNMIKGQKVVNELGVDVTKNFYRGAREFLKIAKKFDVQQLILKDKSPSCGKHGIVTRLLPEGMNVRYIK